MPNAPLKNSSIWYEVAGTGDPTAFLHGSLVDHSPWERVRRGLAPSLTTLVYDRRGHGESRGDPRGRPVRDDAADLAELLEHLDLYPVHLIAHSYGGGVALRLAFDRPEMVRSIVVHEPPFVGLLEADPATAPESERLENELASMVARVHAGDAEGAVRQVVESLSTEEGAWERMGREVQRALIRNVDRWAEEISDPESIRPDPVGTGELLIPVLVTTGERSPPFLHRVAARLSESVRNGTTRTLPGVGHAPHVSDPDLFIALVHGFLVERTVPST